MLINVVFKEIGQRLDVRFGQANQRIPVRFDDIQIVTARPDVEYYEGSYEVTPKVEAQVMPTANKFLTDDMNVTAIPTYSVGNTSGGSTFYIASGGISVLGEGKLGEMVL